ncbi:hypothetical protein [Clostridium psychrophilum]|nr:hypothetical protein [Clostridium psychrophilum]MBU3181430.1 hypothetical protein [Clostridium psychrophilum]
MRKLFDDEYIDDKIRFQGGYAEFRSETRSPSVCVRISYLYKKRENKKTK